MISSSYIYLLNYFEKDTTLKILRAWKALKYKELLFFIEYDKQILTVEINVIKKSKIFHQNIMYPLKPIAINLSKTSKKKIAEKKILKLLRRS